jgi:hypothetical protein
MVDNKIFYKIILRINGGKSIKIIIINKVIIKILIKNIINKTN